MGYYQFYRSTLEYKLLHKYYKYTRIAGELKFGRFGQEKSIEKGWSETPWQPLHTKLLNNFQVVPFNGTACSKNSFTTYINLQTTHVRSFLCNVTMRLLLMAVCPKNICILAFVLRLSESQPTCWTLFFFFLHIRRVNFDPSKFQLHAKHFIPSSHRT